MRRLRLSWALALLTPAALLLACSSGNSNTANNAAKTASVAPPASVAALATAAPSVQTPRPPAQPSHTPAAATATATSAAPSATPALGVPNACVALGTGPVPPNATLPPPTAIPPFTPGPQPVRPAVDLAKLATPSGLVPQGWDALNDGRFDPTNIAGVSAYPQSALAYLQTIGLLGGRVQSWTGPASGGRLPLLAVEYFVFNSDAGASDFLHNPVNPVQYCVRQEQGPSLGMETSYTSFQYSGKLQTNKDGIFEGQTVLWRCGRVLLSAQQVGAPGQFSPSTVSDAAKKVQAEFTKSNSCS